MRHRALMLAATVAAAPALAQPAARAPARAPKEAPTPGVAGATPAAEAPLSVRAELGYWALTNGSTTRSPALAAGIGARWPADAPLGLWTGYRGALRRSGNDVAAVLQDVHTLALGAFARTGRAAGRLGIGVAAVGELEHSRLSGRGFSGHDSVSVGPGGLVELELGLRAGERSWASFVLGAITRRHYVDFTAMCTLEWDVTGR